MQKKVTGKVLKLGDDISSDVILPAPCFMLSDPGELASHALEKLGSGLAEKVAHSYILVAGKNFGIGTGREAPVTCLRHD